MTEEQLKKLKEWLDNELKESGVHLTMAIVNKDRETEEYFSGKSIQTNKTITYIHQLLQEE